MSQYQINIEKDENGMFVGEVVGLPACYTQAKNIPELFDRLMEVSEGSLAILKDMGDEESYKKFTLSLHLDYATA
jgi:predicted RNase H-like HicB family nuclease